MNHLHEHGYSCPQETGLITESFQIFLINKNIDNNQLDKYPGRRHYLGLEKLIQKNLSLMK